jgi:hypothetical protein
MYPVAEMQIKGAIEWLQGEIEWCILLLDHSVTLRAGCAQVTGKTIGGMRRPSSSKNFPKSFQISCKSLCTLSWTTCGLLCVIPRYFTLSEFVLSAKVSKSFSLCMQIPIREAAADALSGCLDIVSLRDASSDNEAFRMVFDQAQRGLKSTNPDTIHGSLLGFKELFVSGRMVS